jgi:hypothetical protein
MGKSIKLSLKPGIWLVTLDKRSGQTFGHFKHRVDIYKADKAKEFINWSQEFLGDFLPWNLYMAGRQEPGFIVPNWVIRYQEPGSAFTEIFVHPDLVPFLLLHWQGRDH